MPAKKTAAKKVPAKKVAKPAKPGKRGRPTSYKPEYDDMAYKFCLLGATDAKLAVLLSVNEDTIHEWKKVHPSFSESIARGKEVADAEIAASLFHRAKGYSHPEDDIRSAGAEIVITPTVKHYPPDTQAASLWLRNRQPALWRDKIDHEHSGKNGGKIEHEVTMTPSEAYRAILGG